MTEERIEPSVDHEYVVTFAQATSEAGESLLSVHVVTTREFTSYAYTLGLNLTIDHARARITIEVGGLSIPSVMMPAAKGAFGEKAIVMPPAGSYVVEVTRRASSQCATLLVNEGGPTSIAPDAEGGFARFRIGVVPQG
ncbi:MAG: hypothetical protein FGM33_08255 [Candidatus Kapabacteria bacterium]|nr:hypothetical protein [Candidatus Kapabacteria bacterium]